MTYTPPTEYGSYINTLMVASGRNAEWLGRLYNPLVPGGSGAGAVSVPVPTAFTAQTISDGTLQTNQYNNTLVALTGYDKTVPISVKPSQARAMEWMDGASLAVIAEQAADGLRKPLISQIIADLVAATPGSTEALAAGKIDFAGAGQTEVAVLNRKITYLLSNSTAEAADLFILMPPAAWGNLFSALSSLVGYTGIGLSGRDGMLYMNGVIPIYGVASTTTAWGGASNACAYVLHKNAYGLKWEGAQPHDPDRFWMPEGDGTYKHLVDGCWYGGVTVAGLIGEVTNPSA